MGKNAYLILSEVKVGREHKDKNTNNCATMEKHHNAFTNIYSDLFVVVVAAVFFCSVRYTYVVLECDAKKSTHGSLKIVISTIQLYDSEQRVFRG